MYAPFISIHTHSSELTDQETLINNNMQAKQQVHSAVRKYCTFCTGADGSAH